MVKHGKWRKAILVLAVCALLIPYPFPIEMDDGGTEIYQAALWRVEKCHRMWQEGAVGGYLTGTIVSILSLEVYNDVMFVPSE